MAKRFNGFLKGLRRGETNMNYQLGVWSYNCIDGNIRVCLGKAASKFWGDGSEVIMGDSIVEMF